MSVRLLELEEVPVGYKSTPVLRGVNMDVEGGEVVALLGANGAGKTTMLKTISGILPVTAGTLTVVGEPVRKGRPWLVARRGVAHVPEDRGLFFQLTVRENLTLVARPGSTDLDRIFSDFPSMNGSLK